MLSNSKYNAEGKAVQCCRKVKNKTYRPLDDHRDMYTVDIEGNLHRSLSGRIFYMCFKSHRTTESNTLQGYIISAIDSERAY